MAIVKQAINYQHGNTPMQGYLAFDDEAGGKRPGVLVVHEWWGLNDYIRRRAEEVAELGYVAFALDMYGQGKTTASPEEAGKLMNALFSNPDTQGRLQAAMDVLRNHPSVNNEKLAAMGYCMGGALCLHMARAGIPLKGVVSFHGSLKPDQRAQPGGVKASVLVCHGADDPMAPMDQLLQFEQEMCQAKADYQIVIFGRAQHAFTNPNADRAGVKGLQYNARADRRSWEALKSFFREVLA